MDKINSKILVISDTHAPFHHKDSTRFLAAVKNSFKPTRVVHIGDEVDNHGISFHDSDPDLMSPSDELRAAQKYCQILQNMFPVMDLLHSNHGSLIYRRAKVGGLPRHYLKDYKDVLLVDDRWQWHEELEIKISDEQTILFRHQFSTNILKTAEQMACCVVQGHYHSKFEISYTSSPRALNWGMTVGCLIDKKALAFEYNKLQVKRPILGVGLIENGLPRLQPMYLDQYGNWTGRLF